ncbi:MAG TPA: hypothetical protein VK175_06355 [Leadbetterella sp.]|nr:hypothetical protein [Leadbetterella sp.]
MWIASVEAKGLRLREELHSSGKRMVWNDLTRGLNRSVYEKFVDVENKIEELKSEIKSIAAETGHFIADAKVFVPGFDTIIQETEEDDLWFFVEGVLIVKFTKVNLGYNDPERGWQRKVVEKVMGEG